MVCDHTEGNAQLCLPCTQPVLQRAKCGSRSQVFIQPGAPNMSFPSSVEVLTCRSERNAYFALHAADGHNVALSPLDHGGEKC